MSASLPQITRNVPGFYAGGWGGPEYTDWMDEQLSWKNTCYIGDWSYLWTATFKGPDAFSFLRGLTINSFENFAVGQAKHMINCNEYGKVVTEGIVLRLGEDEFCTQSIPTWWCGFQFGQGSYDATMTFPDIFKYQVQGPKSVSVIEKAAGESVRDVPFMHFKTIRIADVEVLALRQGMSGEVGFELQGPSGNGPKVHAAIMEAGQEYGIRRLGSRTVMINHLEACFPTSAYHFVMAVGGYEYSEAYNTYMVEHYHMPIMYSPTRGSFESEDIRDYHVSPIELGWGKNIKFDHDFVGRGALDAEMASPKRGMVTLEYNKDDLIDIYASMFEPGESYEFMDIPTRQHHVCQYNKVLRDGKLVGISSNPGYSYYFRKMLSLTMIDLPHSQIGTEVTVIWGEPGRRQKEIRATVAPCPYKKDNRRLDLHQLP